MRRGLVLSSMRPEDSQGPGRRGIGRKTRSDLYKHRCRRRGGLQRWDRGPWEVEPPPECLTLTSVVADLPLPVFDVAYDAYTSADTQTGERKLD